MDGISVLEFLSILLTIGQKAWNLYCAYKRAASAAEITKLHAELDQAVGKLKSATTTKELQDAASALAQSHNDILR